MLGACAAALIKSLKHLAGIDPELKLITEDVITPISKMKVDYLGSNNPRLHMDEVLIALSASSNTNAIADVALKQLSKLRGAQVHSTCRLNPTDEKLFQKLGMMLTTDAK